MLFALFLAPLGALAVTTTTSSTSVQDFDFAQVNVAPSPAFTAPPVGVNSQSIPYDSASVSSEGAAAATTPQTPLSVVSSLATASIPQSLIVALSETPTDSIPPSSVVASSGTPTVSTPPPLVIASSDTPTLSPPSLGVAQSDTSTSTVPTIIAKRVAQPAIRFPRQVVTPKEVSNSFNIGEVAELETSSNSTVIEQVDELEKGFTDEAAAPHALAKRGDCSVQPDGWALPLPLIDDVPTFMAFSPYRLSSIKAVTPPGYQKTFSNLNASVSANSYLGLQTLRSYDIVGCSKWCDNTTLCTGFNIFYERDPSLDPGPACPTPPTIVNYKCTLWGSGVEPAAANNFGQWREQYQVVISGSNGYEKTNTTQPTTPKGCLKPQRCVGGALRAVAGVLKPKFFPGPFDISLCAAYANAQNAINKEKSQNWYTDPTKCKLFNAYMVKRDGIAMGTYCSLYAQYYAPSAATYQPGRIAGRFWAAESSFTVIVTSGWI